MRMTGFVAYCDRMVVHHGPRGWRSATDVVALIDFDGVDGATKAFLHPLQPHLRFLLIDLPEVTLERLRQLTMTPWARLVLVCLQFVRGQDADAALVAVRAAIDLVRQVYVSRGGGERLDQVWYYSFKVSDLVPEQVRDLLETEVDPHAGGTVKTTADRMYEQIIREDRAATLLRLAGKRFGPIPETSSARIRSAPATELDRWLDRILDAPTLDALFAD